MNYVMVTILGVHSKCDTVSLNHKLNWIEAKRMKWSTIWSHQCKSLGLIFVLRISTTHRHTLVMPEIRFFKSSLITAWIMAATTESIFQKNVEKNEAHWLEPRLIKLLLLEFPMQLLIYCQQSNIISVFEGLPAAFIRTHFITSHWFLDWANGSRIQN